MSPKIKDSANIEVSAPIEEIPAEGFLTTPHLMNALVNEVIRSRIRFRGLLRLLIANKIIEERDYVTEYEQEEDASFLALADTLLLELPQVMQKHADWLQSERGRFASMSPGRSIPRINLMPVQGKPD